MSDEDTLQHIKDVELLILKDFTPSKADSAATVYVRVNAVFEADAGVKLPSLIA